MVHGLLIREISGISLVIVVTCVGMEGDARSRECKVLSPKTLAEQYDLLGSFEDFQHCRSRGLIGQYFLGELDPHPQPLSEARGDQLGLLIVTTCSASLLKVVLPKFGWRKEEFGDCLL